VLFGESPQTRLVGIARLAASGELLEAKRRVEYFELPTRSYFTRCNSGRVPFEWTINPYRGCEYGCKYCYARYTHEFMELRNSQDFETKVFAKQWEPAVFRRELRRIRRESWIAIGTATDPYQPAERRHGITRRMLEILVKEQGRRLSLTTKSDLVTRDLELFAALAKANVFHIAVTITTMNEALARKLEPYAPRPSLRMAAVERLSKAGLKVGVLACPLLPGISDSEESIDAVASEAASAGAAYFASHVVFLKACAKQAFYPFLEENYPHLARIYRVRFGATAYLRGAYPEAIRERVRKARQRHGLGERFPEYLPDQWPQEPQMELPFADTNFTLQSTC